MPQPKRRRSKETFGLRLARIRKARALSQRDLARRLHVSQRMVAYYESQTDHPPSHLLPELAKILSVSIDELLGVGAHHATEPVDIDVRLLRRIQRIQQLPPGTKRAVLKVIDDLLASHGVDADEDTSE